MSVFFLSPNKVCAFVRTACWVRSAHGFFKRRAYIADGRESGEATKKSPEGLFLSRRDSVDIAWEHRAFLDVGDAEEAGRDTLEVDGEAAVRRHAVSLCSPLCLSPVRALSLPRAAGAHISRPAWHIRAR